MLRLKCGGVMEKGATQEYRGWEILRRADGSYVAAISETIVFDDRGIGYKRLRFLKHDINAHQNAWSKLKEYLRRNREA